MKKKLTLKRVIINRRTLKGGSVPTIQITENQTNNLPNSVMTRDELLRWTNLNNQMRRERERQAQWTRNHEQRIRPNNIQQRREIERIRIQQERDSAPEQVVYNLYVVGDPEFYEQIDSDNLGVNLYDATLKNIHRYILFNYYWQTYYLRDENTTKIVIYTRDSSKTNEWTRQTRSRNLRDIGMLKNDIDIRFEYA